MLHAPFSSHWFFKVIATLLKKDSYLRHIIDAYTWPKAKIYLYLLILLLGKVVFEKKLNEKSQKHKLAVRAVCIASDLADLFLIEHRMFAITTAFRRYGKLSIYCVCVPQRKSSQLCFCINCLQLGNMCFICFRLMAFRTHSSIQATYGFV